MDSEKLHEELAYLESFGLRLNPFPVAPDVEHFFLSSNIDGLITEIVHGTLTRKGFMILTGEVGLGKTTITRKVIKILEEKGVLTSLVFHTSYQETELLREINRDFDLPPESLELGDQMKVLRDFLLDQNREGRNCAILIDDAQNLNNSSLELVRMISNLEVDQEKLVQILLVGQPELMNKLESSELRQLKSRIIISREVRPLTEEELKNYILFKLNAAGSMGKTSVDQKAVRKIHKLTGGNIRQLNKLMDRCLYVAYLNNITKISPRIVGEAQKDLLPATYPKVQKNVFFRAAMLLFSICIFLAILYPLPAFQKGLLLLKNQNSNHGIEAARAEEKAKAPAPSRSKGRDHETGALRSRAREQTKTATAETEIPEAVSDFLSAYGLDRFARVFYEALKARDYGKVSRKIYRASGYSLIRLHNLPETLRRKYGVLFIPSEGDNENYYLLFWHPELQVKKFYYGYIGEEIKKLQRLLANEQMYRGSLDGMVGKGLMKAVVAFQKKHDLEVSGYPDERTLFLLHNTKSPRKRS